MGERTEQWMAIKTQKSEDREELQNALTGVALRRNPIAHGQLDALRSGPQLRQYPGSASRVVAQRTPMIRVPCLSHSDVKRGFGPLSTHNIRRTDKAREALEVQRQQCGGSKGSRREVESLISHRGRVHSPRVRMCVLNLHGMQHHATHRCETGDINPATVA